MADTKECTYYQKQKIGQNLEAKLIQGLQKLCRSNGRSITANVPTITRTLDCAGGCVVWVIRIVISRFRAMARNFFKIFLKTLQQIEILVVYLPNI